VLLYLAVVAHRWRQIGFVCLLACGPKTSDEADGGNACEQYLDCLAATDQDLFEEELEIYGAMGSCFDNSSRETCYEACDQKRAALGEDDEACVDPPEEEPEVPDTPPGEDGKIDCADVPAGASTVGGTAPGPLGFPTLACDPRISGAGEHICCSDDPSAVGGALPDYQNKDIGGATPIFSGVNNALSTWGLCVRTSDIPAGSGLLEMAASNCPIPCDPTWGETDVATVCGANRVCCQTLELQPEDCVLDPETQQWRPARGTDVLDGLSTWAPSEHATHQDANGTGCATFTDGNDGAYVDCVAQLRVASQRGFCMALGPGQACPAEDPSYVDACTAINMALIPPPE
jgi:hypothetical protein